MELAYTLAALCWDPGMELASGQTAVGAGCFPRLRHAFQKTWYSNMTGETRRLTPVMFPSAMLMRGTAMGSLPATHGPGCVVTAISKPVCCTAPRTAADQLPLG